MRWWGHTGRPKKSGFGSVFGGTQNPALTPRAGRTKFGARRHGAPSWCGPPSIRRDRHTMPKSGSQLPKNGLVVSFEHS